MESSARYPNNRILILDDNPSIHSDFKEILCPDGSDEALVREMEAVLFEAKSNGSAPSRFELHSAFQGQEGLEKVREALAQNRPFALAFVDVRMPPGWDGIESIARIWQLDPDLQVVVCTAYSDYSWEEMRAKVGYPDNLLVLKKPFDNIEVQQLAHALTRKWQLNHEAKLAMAELGRANDTLAKSEERFAKAFHESPLPSGIQSFPDQRFVDVNQRLAEVCGRSRDQMIGRTPVELGLWEKPALADQWYAAVTRHELVRDQEANICSQAGGLREVLVSLSPIALGEQSHVLLLAQDISERALLERQLRHAQKMEAIGQLAAGVAHDFNNILTVIQGHAGLMHQKIEPGNPQAKSIEQITRATARAATLIRQLLVFSRKQVMQFRNLDLNDTLRNSIQMLERLVGEHVQIEFKPQDKLPAISADGSMIEQIAMNLSVNARDAMPNGGKISIVTTCQSLKRPPTAMDPENREGHFVCLSFSDNGEGMEPHVLSRVFEPFFTTKAVGKGTGLGLSTVFGIVRQHRGWLEVDSKLRQGTSFRIYFPACEKPAEKSEPVGETALRSGSETVLIAEDELALREMVAQALRMQGYKVLEAASGVDALRVWEEVNGRVDLLLTDMVMPGGIMGGELAERLCKRAPGLKVIYTSGYSPGMAGRDATVMGRRNFLPKPYSVGRLSQIVRECLDEPASCPESNGRANSYARCVEEEPFMSI